MRGPAPLLWGAYESYAAATEVWDAAGSRTVLTISRAYALT
ncbi:hypothetical protein [Streptomyces sp. NPDC046182]